MHALAITYQPYLPRIAAVLAIICAIAAFCYGALLLETVAHAAGRQTAERQVQALTVELSSLESRYLAATEAITPAQATALGYVPAPQNDIAVVTATPLEPLSLR